MADLTRSLASQTGYLEVRRKGDNARRAVIEPYLYLHAFALYLKALRYIKLRSQTIERRVVS